MDKAAARDDQRRSRRLFASLATCCSTFAGFDERKCERACRGSIRGQIGTREEERQRGGGEVTEMDELRCTLLGRKPLVLLHRLSPEAQTLISACRHVPQPLSPSHNFPRGVDPSCIIDAVETPPPWSTSPQVPALFPPRSPHPALQPTRSDSLML
jgi:hypothetical protein